ncbi:transferase family-domain-containing protein [Aspergillus coremiiformis]|uniref:Transferase family-domain-containing protein n=1 Tax=Aspergillus coremiiformis TaxID=138285 RepID=A0A5N6Z418_9EURO|nr:transferase family-domain-containing protein [Aspergillus coremiiformis]
MPVFFTFSLKDPSAGLPIIQNAASRLFSRRPFLMGNVIEQAHLGNQKRICEVRPPDEQYMRYNRMLTVKYHKEDIASQKPSSEIAGSLPKSEAFVPVPFDHTRSDPQPIFRIQANMMEDGIILCFSFHHRVMDATGLCAVISSFAEYCRDSEVDNDLLLNEEDHAHVRAQIADCTGESSVCYNKTYGVSEFTGAKNVNDPHGLQSRSFRFSAERIHHLRTACNGLASEFLVDVEHLRGLGNGGRQSTHSASASGLFTRNDIFTALLWLCRARAKKEDLSSPSPLLFAADIRSILQPPLPRNYMGNSMAFLKASAPIRPLIPFSDQVKEILPADASFDPNDLRLLLNLALQIRQRRKSIDNNHVHGLISYVNNLTDWGNAIFRPTDTIVSNIRHVPFYQLGFGPVLGRVQHYEIPENRTEGVTWLLPARPPSTTDSYKDLTQAPWEFRWTLRQETVDKLRKDRLLQWVSILD